MHTIFSIKRKNGSVVETVKQCYGCNVEKNKLRKFRLWSLYDEYGNLKWQDPLLNYQNVIDITSKTSSGVYYETIYYPCWVAVVLNRINGDNTVKYKIGGSTYQGPSSNGSTVIVILKVNSQKTIYLKKTSNSSQHGALLILGDLNCKVSFPTLTKPSTATLYDTETYGNQIIVKDINDNKIVDVSV